MMYHGHTVLSVSSFILSQDDYILIQEYALDRGSCQHKKDDGILQQDN